MDITHAPAGDASTFERHRSLLFSIAYRMLGTRSEAEDMVQETFLRWHNAPRDQVDSPQRYLCTTVTRLCIDHLRLARVKREQYVGPWLPEPLISDRPQTEDAHAMLAESLSIAFLLVLESLDPVERAVFLLREVFEYEYADIARVVEKSEANCRQIFKRAKDHIASRRPRLEASPEAQQQLMAQFVQAVSTGDTAGLEALFANDISVRSDGGGKARAATKVVVGSNRAARLLIGLSRKAAFPYTVELVWVNNHPGVLLRAEGRPIQVLTLDIVEGRIQDIYMVLNPDKLAALA